MQVSEGTTRKAKQERELEHAAAENNRIHRSGVGDPPRGGSRGGGMVDVMLFQICTSRINGSSSITAGSVDPPPSLPLLRDSTRIGP